jgi:hypothetical protein
MKKNKIYINKLIKIDKMLIECLMFIKQLKGRNMINIMEKDEK